LNINNARYELTAVRPDQYPASNVPEVAFVGRSNVGKSSIINALLNRKNLAKTGATPGKTRQINFYNIDDALYFVDLPGYGYAKVSKGEKHSWGKLADTYLLTRKQVKLIIMLVDIRHTPTEDDKLMFQWIKSSGISHIIVASKSDKIQKSKIAKNVSEIKKFFGTDEAVLPFSSEKKQGRDELWQVIKDITGIKSPLKGQ
jgi:GTP-binding protein